MQSLSVQGRVRVVYLIGFIDLLGVSMMIPLLAKFTHSLGASRTMAGFIGSLYGAIQIFSSSIVGQMSDKYGRRRMLLWSYSISSVGYFSLALSNSVLMLALSRIPSGVLKHGLSISRAYLVDITDPDERASVLGYSNAISSMGFIIGPLIAGYLADLDTTLRLSIFTGACVFFSNLFMILFILPPTKKDLLTTSQSEGFAFFFRNLSWRKLYSSIDITGGVKWKKMKVLTVVRVLGMLSVMIIRFDFPVFMDQNFDITNTIYGQITSFNSIVAVIASGICGVAAKRYPGLFKLATPGFVFLFVSSCSLVLASTVTQVVIVNSFLSIATSYLRLCMLNLMLDMGEDNNEGAILGFTNSLSSICRMLAPSLVGVAQEYGSKIGQSMAALLALVATLGLLLFPHSVPHSKHSRKEPQTTSRNHHKVL